MTVEYGSLTRLKSYELLVFGGIDLKKPKQSIIRTELQEVSLASNAKIGTPVHLNQFPDLVVLSDSIRGSWCDHLNTLLELQAYGYPGKAVVITDSPSFGGLVEAFDSGLSDYIIEGSYVDNGIDFEPLITIPKADRQLKSPSCIKKMGLFRSLGLSNTQLDLLVAYASSFSRLTELAQTLGKSENQLRKAFSRIYEKLRGPLSVDCPARLAHVLTMCLRVP